MNRSFKKKLVANHSFGNIAIIDGRRLLSYLSFKYPFVISK